MPPEIEQEAADATFAREVARLLLLIFVGLVAVSSVLVWLAD